MKLYQWVGNVGIGHEILIDFGSIRIEIRLNVKIWHTLLIETVYLICIELGQVNRKLFDFEFVFKGLKQDRDDVFSNLKWVSSHFDVTARG
jgi:hypothetical protein